MNVVCGACPGLTGHYSPPQILKNGSKAFAALSSSPSSLPTAMATPPSPGQSHEPPPSSSSTVLPSRNSLVSISSCSSSSWTPSAPLFFSLDDILPCRQLRGQRLFTSQLLHFLGTVCHLCSWPLVPYQALCQIQGKLNNTYWYEFLSCTRCLLGLILSTIEHMSQFNVSVLYKNMSPHCYLHSIIIHTPHLTYVSLFCINNSLVLIANIERESSKMANMWRAYSIPHFFNALLVPFAIHLYLLYYGWFLYDRAVCSLVFVYSRS